MTRALEIISYRLRLAVCHGIFRSQHVPIPRVGYCRYCGAWAWRTKEAVARSTATTWLCEECADAEEKEVDVAWREYYSGVL